MADTSRPRLAPIDVQHARSMSAQSTDSDSSDSSPDGDDEEKTEYFVVHPNDSQTETLGAMTPRARGSVIDLEQLHRISPISKLPPELLLAIFQKLATTGDLRNCMLVSYHWALYTVGILWHRPLCGKWSNLQNVARTLSEHRPLFPYNEMVKRLNLSAIADKVNNGTVLAFKNCKGIERLTLTNCSKLTDSGVEGIVDGSKRLQALDVTELDSLTDRTLLKVADNCPKLQGLNITNCSSITDESLTAVAQRCTQLKRLKLNGVFRATDTSVTAVARNCRSILEIDLAGCQSITSESVTALLTNLPNLRELRLAHCTDIRDLAFTNVSSKLRFDALRILDLTACEGIRDDAIAKIIPAAPRLRNLVLAKCRHITDLAVNAICSLTKNLHYIHLGHCTNLTDQAVINLVKSCNRIRYIDLACCSRLTDASVKYLAQLPKLRRIGLVKCQNLNDASIIALAKGPYGSSGNKPGIPSQFVSLERVHLSYCVNLTLKGITQLLLNCPRLTHLSLTGVQAFLREDLTRFCREAPSEFTHPQRDVFCVFSGEGVMRLRDHLARLAIEEQEREQQNAIEERLYGPDSPENDSVSDDGTLDGNEHTMDFVFGPGRYGSVPVNPRARPRPRSLHELPSYHVEMPLLPGDQMQRLGPWTPNAPLTPEMRAAMGPSRSSLMGADTVWYPDGSSEPARSPMPQFHHASAPAFVLDPPLPPPSYDSHRSRSQSRRHTLAESSSGYFNAPSSAWHMAGSSSSRAIDVPENNTRQSRSQVPFPNRLLPPLTSTRRSGPQISGTSVRPELGPRQASTSLRPEPEFSAFDANYDAIMATIPRSRGPSRGQSRSNSPHVSRVSSQSRIGAFFGNLRGLSSAPFHTDIAARPSLSSRSRERSRHREGVREAMLQAMGVGEPEPTTSAFAAAPSRSAPHLARSPAAYPGIPSAYPLNTSRLSEALLLPPGLMQHVPLTPMTATSSPSDTVIGFDEPEHGTGRRTNQSPGDRDVNMTQ